MAALALTLLAGAAAANPVIFTDYPRTSAHFNLGLFAADKTPLKIASEDLYVSPDLVRVRYVLANDTGKVRTEPIFFPLPEINVGDYWFDRAKDGTPQRAMLGRHTADPHNFIAARVSVNGKPVPVEVYQSAWVWRGRLGGEMKQVEISGEIKAAGLPVMLFGKSDALNRLPEAARRKLFDVNLLSTHDEDWQPGRYPKTYYPTWRVATGFHWQQPFPAKGTVSVDVTYQPMTGGSLRPVRGSQIWGLHPECIQDLVWPDWTPWGITHRKSVMYRTTGYIVTTATTWNGPIGKFHLTVDKQNPKAVLSLCWKGKLKKTGPTTYEYSAERFVPADDILLTVVE